jgi:transcriptional regulator with XRE-family HTH domain
MKKKQNLIKKALEILKQSGLTAYKIAQDTGIHETTISNYRTDKTTPTHANAKLLLYYFDEINNNANDIANMQTDNISNNIKGSNVINNIKGSNNIGVGKGNSFTVNSNGADKLHEIIKEKETQITNLQNTFVQYVKEKDEYIDRLVKEAFERNKEKDEELKRMREQIDKLLNMIDKLTDK